MRNYIPREETMELVKYSKLVRELVMLGRPFNVACHDVAYAYGLNKEELVKVAKLAHIDEVPKSL